MKNKEAFQKKFKKRIDEIYNQNKDQSISIKKTRINQSNEETCYLLAGVELCGKSNWTQIFFYFCYNYLAIIISAIIILLL